MLSRKCGEKIQLLLSIPNFETNLAKYKEDLSLTFRDD